MKKSILITGLSIIIFSCGNNKSAETMKLENDLDSVKKYGIILDKYENSRSELMATGSTPEQATATCDSIYKSSYPIKGAEWNK